MIKKKLSIMTKFRYISFLVQLKKEIKNLRKEIKISNEELDLVYKILRPTPISFPFSEVVEMQDQYDLDLWSMKKEQIYSVLGKRNIDIRRIVQYCQLKYVEEALKTINEKEISQDDCEINVYSARDTIAGLYKNYDFFMFGEIIVEETWYKGTKDQEEFYEIICPYSCGFFTVHIKDSDNEEILKKLLGYCG